MCFPIFVVCVRPVKKLQIMGIIDLRTPSSINFFTTMLWLTRSNAFVKSIVVK